MVREWRAFIRHAPQARSTKDEERFGEREIARFFDEHGDEGQGASKPSLGLSTLNLVLAPDLMGSLSVVSIPSDLT